MEIQLPAFVNFICQLPVKTCGTQLNAEMKIDGVECLLQGRGKDSD